MQSSRRSRPNRAAEIGAIEATATEPSNPDRRAIQ